MNLKLLLCSYLCFLSAIGHTQTITISNSAGNCFNNTVIPKTGTDATGRNVYQVDMGGGLVIRVRWDIGQNRWEIIQTSDGFEFYYHTTSTSNPLPPTSGWTVGGGCDALTQFVLPIELSRFDAQNTKGTNLLAWSTASEKNNEGFDIERSLDGTAFQKIGFVKGNGTTNQPQQYTYTDALVGAVTYYRLKQVDTDGKFEYSKVVSVESNGDGLRVYPTLVSDGVLTVQGGQSDDCIVTNLLGQPVWMGKTTQQLDVSAWARGTYLLRVGSEVTKFVKQ